MYACVKVGVCPSGCVQWVVVMMMICDEVRGLHLSDHTTVSALSEPPNTHQLGHS